VVLVAGFISSLSDLITGNPQDMEIAKPWLETPIDLVKARLNADKIVSIVSDDDPYIPEDNWEKFTKLGDLLILHGKGHIQDPKEPKVLDAVLEVMK